jgi:hypothetical protein
VFRVTDLLSSSKGFDPSALTPLTVGQCRLKSVETHVECAWSHRLKVTYDKLLLSFAFKINLRRYMTDALRQPAARSFIQGVVGGVVQRVTARVLKVRSCNLTRLNVRVEIVPFLLVIVSIFCHQRSSILKRTHSEY